MITVEDLVVALGDERVLDGVSLSVEAGDFVGLIGPNGAGKTTLLRAINGALSPREGLVEIDGENVHRLSSRAASRLVSTVPQTTQLSFEFTVREAVEMGRTPHRSRFGTWTEDDTEAVDSALARTAVADLADRPVTDISGGERQRVLIARALAQTTPVMLLDEPTASLDINHQVRTLELVRDLVEEGKTALAAIHDLNLAAHYCDRLVLLSNRRVLAAGPPEAVLTEAHLREAFDTNAVVSRHPVTGSVYVTALPDVGVGPGGEAAGRVHVVGGGGSAARVLYLLSAAGYTVTAGALNEGDTDAETARHLGVDLVTVPPYSSVDEAAREAVEERVAAADVVVVTDVEVGEGNLPNLEVAMGADRVVLVEERPFPERNFAGEAGTTAYERLRREATVVGARDVVSAVGAALDGREPRDVAERPDDHDGRDTHSVPSFPHSSSPSPSSES
ncbi:heme ABC transporter ATP-binding protein [Salinigranum rubrum]|uniref:Cobalamin import ATP-binding protein BtuD n=1 Tax=Salinigranum rubrum TaxID=755307 RepID=A0A2I8VHR6_9EURY|nr:heme ABC transporter ATP-binding protein [Salinigranum rubrum]AUV81455.1 heme ABC transporter ATP-binding protein [Salinigranum rubrum]